jgi:hypothetical protein
MIIKNELAFFIQLFGIGFFLLQFAKKKYETFLESSFLVFFFIINIFSMFELKTFGIYITPIEPIAIGMYFIGIILYSYNHEKSDKTIQNLFKINILIIALLLSISLYNQESTEFQFLSHHLFYTFLISCISFSLSYIIERKIYQQLQKRISNILSQALSVACGQFFDTAFYTICIFYQKSLYIIISIFSFSYIIKLFCISIYTVFLMFQKKIKNE